MRTGAKLYTFGNTEICELPTFYVPLTVRSGNKRSENVNILLGYVIRNIYIYLTVRRHSQRTVWPSDTTAINMHEYYWQVLTNSTRNLFEVSNQEGGDDAEREVLRPVHKFHKVICNGPKLYRYPLLYKGIFNIWAVLYILCSSCQLALFGYPNWGFSVLFPQF
jgi:hypothetical protein